MTEDRREEMLQNIINIANEIQEYRYCKYLEKDVRCSGNCKDCIQPKPVGTYPAEIVRGGKK